MQRFAPLPWILCGQQPLAQETLNDFLGSATELRDLFFGRAGNLIRQFFLGRLAEESLIQAEPPFQLFQGDGWLAPL